MDMTRKSSLIAGEILDHLHLGQVVFTATCQELERLDGEPSSLFVQDGDEVKQVTLGLIQRRTKGGHYIRMMA